LIPRLAILLLAVSGHAYGQTLDEMMQACQAQAIPSYACGGGGYTRVCEVGREATPTQRGEMFAGWQCGDGGRAGNIWGFDYSAPNTCSAGGGSFSGSYALAAIDANGNACDADGCEYEFDQIAVEIDGRMFSQWSQTGEQCENGSDGSDESERCREVGGGYRVCAKGDQVCVTTARGNDYCWDPNAEQCNTSADQREAACIGSPNAPDPTNNPDDDFDDWQPPVEIQVGTSGGPVTVEVRSRDPRDPDDDDDEEEDDPDCPANDPECEEDDDDVTAADSGCETQTPSCSDTSAVECQILYRTHRTKCEIEHSNKLIAEFRDKQLAEVRETNAKLKALIEHEKQWRAEQVIQATDQKTATEQVKTAVTEATGATITAIDGTREGVLNGLGEIRDELKRPKQATPSLTCATAPECGGDPIGCAQLVQSWRAGCLAGGAGDSGQPPWTQVAPVDPSEGITDADGERIGVTPSTLSVSDVDTGGFLGGGACPVLPQLSIGGTPVEIDPTVWCDFLALLKVVFSIAGAWAAVQILTR
jgi:hypothetical protein